MSDHDTSDNDSEQQRTRVHSLFPIKSSLQTKDSSINVHNLFNPHSQDQSETKSNKQMSETEESIQRQARSESEFLFKTPCDEQMSDQSQKREASSSIKDFEVKTVFIPFSHQSLTKVVWSSEKVIPEERQDIEKKEPTNQLEGSDIEVLDFQNVNKSEDNQCFQELNLTYDENMKVSQDQNVGMTTPFLKIQLMSEINKVAERSIEEKQFEKEYLETISVRSLSKKEPVCPKQEKQLFQVNQIMKSEILQQQYVSKATVYYQNERNKLQRCNHYYEHFSQSANSHKLAFSNIETISVRYTPIKTSDFDQQTERPKFQNSNLEFISVKDAPLETMNFYQQTQRPKFQNSKMSSQKVNPFINQNIKIGIPYFDKVDSVKKCNFEAQTSFENRLLAISKGYHEKIGIIKEVTNRGEQAVVELFNAQIQTEAEEKKKKSLTFCQQLNFTVSFDHEKRLCNQIIGFEKYLKQINEERKQQLLEERARKSVCQSTNTQNCLENQTQVNIGSNNSKDISCKSFACQYDQDDIRSKPSLKRTSLSNKKQSKQIPDDNVIIILSDDVEGHQKKKRGRKSKKQLQKLKIEFGRDQDQQVQLPEPESVEKRRKSKKLKKF